MVIPYLEGFTEQDEAYGLFLDYSERNGATWPRNLRLIAATYQREMYEGYAFVLYKNLEDGKFYIIEGSHCSCNGLEGQWCPVVTTPEAVKHMLEGGWSPLNNTSLHEFLRTWVAQNQTVETVQSDISSLETDVAILEKKVEELRTGKMNELTNRRQALTHKKLLLEQELKNLRTSLGMNLEESED